MQDTAFLLFVVGLLPAGGLWWLWRRTGTPGDVYVTGRVPAAGVDAHYLDQLLGALLQAADAHFNELLAIGFLTSMQKEWDWRVSRGESLRNLEAFRSLLDHSSDGG